MANRPSDNRPLQQLKHEPVPGYFKAFVIAFAVMGIYLALILITSPGPANEHHKSKDPAGKAKSGTSH